MGLGAVGAQAQTALYSSNTPGTWSYQVPGNVYWVIVALAGGGGGGGGADSAPGGKGGDGALVYAKVNVGPGTTIGGVIGGGGSGGGSVACSAASPAGGTGAAAGGLGGKTGCTGASGSGGGGGGSSTLVYGTVTLLQAGGGGGGGGGSYGTTSGTNSTGGSGSAITLVSGACASTAQGGNGAQPSGDGGGGGGGGGGYQGGTGGAGGAAGKDSTTYATGGVAGTSCSTFTGSNLAAGSVSASTSPNNGGAAGTTSNGWAGSAGGAGSVTIYATGNYWDGTQTSANGVVDGGNGTWNSTALNWTTDSGNANGPWAGGTVWANFGGAQGAVTVSGSQDIGGLNFITNGYTLSGGSLNLTQSTAQIQTGSGINATVNSPITGNYGFSKIGAGTLTLSGANTYSGATTVNAGTLVLQNTNASSIYNIASGTTLEWNVASNGTTIDSATATFQGSGTFRKTGPGILQWGAGAATFSLGSGSLIDVQGGIFTGGNSGNEVWTNNLSDLNIASGALFKGVEANVRVNRLTGSGKVSSGLNSSSFTPGITVGVDGGSATFDGVVADGDSPNNSTFTKAGSGTQTLTGNNTYSSNIAISAGTLQLGGAGTLGWNGINGAYAGNIANNGTLQYSSSANQTLSGVISGTGSLIKDTSSSSTLTLSSFNTFSGGTTVNAGTLNLTQAGGTNGCASSPVQSVLGTGPLTVAAGATVSFNGPSTLGCPMNDPTLAASVPQINLSGTLTLDASNDSAVTHLPLVIMSTGSNITSTGTPGSMAQQYGAYNFDAGVQVTGDSTLSASYVANRASGGVPFTISPGKTLTVSGYFGKATSTSVTNTGFSVAGGGTMLFSGGASSATGPITVSNGKIQIGDGGANGDISSFDSVNLSSTSGNLSFNRSDNYTFGKAISGSGNVSQVGSGTTTLTANNSYSGSTTVSNGTLAFYADDPVNQALAGTFSNGTTVTYKGVNTTTNSTGVTYLNGVVSGSGTWTVDASTANANVWANRLVFTNLNSVTGDMTVTNYGRLWLQSAGTAGNPQQKITLSGSNAGLYLYGNNGSTVQIGDLNGGGTVDFMDGAAGKALTLSIGNNNKSGSFGGIIINSGTNLGPTVLSIRKDGTGTQTLSGTNTYSGSTTVSAGTLAYGAVGAVPAASAVTVALGATLDLNSLAVNRSANTTVSGTLALGTNGSLTLGSGTTNSIAAITGSGTITVGSNATLTLSSAISNPNVNIVMAGGVLKLNGSTHSIGTLTQTAASTIDFSGGSSKLTVALLGNLGTAGTLLTASNWTAGTTNFYATNVTGSPAPARNTLGLTPLNQISLGGASSSLTYWAPSTANNEILLGAAVGSYTYWDTNAALSSIDGGPGTWDGVSNNWTTSSGSPNGTWSAGGVATFQGTPAATVTIADGYNASIGGLTFGVTGYTITRNTSGTLALAQDANITIPGSMVATIGAPITSTSKGITVMGGGNLTLSGANTYVGSTTVSGGTLTIAQAVGDGDNTGMGSTQLIVGDGASLVINTPTRTNIGYAGATTISLGNGSTLDVTGINGSGGVVLYKNPVTVSTTASAAATLKSTSSIGLNMDTTSALTLNTAAGSTLNISAVLWNAGALTKTGGGTAVLTGANSYTGSTTISGGTLQLGNGSTTGDIAGTASITVSGTGTLSFNRSNAYNFGKVISGTGKVSQDGSGTTTLTGANTYSGGTTVNAGTLAIGANGALPSAGTVTVNSGGALNLGTFTQSLTAALTVNTGGKLVLGTGSNLTLSNSSTPFTSNVAAIESSSTGTITVGTGATLTLTGAINAPNLSIVMAGGTLNLGTGQSHTIGSLTQNTASSTITFGSNSSLTVATLGSLGTGLTLTASNWTQGTTRFYATAVTGSPAKNQVGLAPMNQVKLGSNAATATYWSSTGNELLPMATGTYTYWDTNASNTTVDGGPGNWDGTTLNWTTSSGTPNGTWAGGTNVATFAGTGAAVSVTSAQSMGGMTFNVDGYTLSGSTLTGAATSNPLTVTNASHTATIANVLAGSNAFTKSGAGTLVLSGANTFSGGLTVSAGKLVSKDQLSNMAGNVTISPGATLEFNNIGSQQGFSGNWSVSGALNYAGDNESRTSVRINGALTSSAATFNVTGTNILSTNGAYGRLVLTGNVTGDGKFLLSNHGDLSLENAGINSTISADIDSTSVLSVYNGTIAIGSLSGSGKVGTTLAGTATISIGNDNASKTFDGVLSATSRWGAASTLNLIKAGTGTQTLTGSNTYTGTTTVNGGTLLVNGSTASASAVSVAGSATLGGTGTVAGTVTVSGTLTAGATAAAGSVGILNTGALTFSGGATLALDLGNNGTPGTDYDQIKVTGNLSLNGNLTLNKLAGFNTTGKYTLITYTGTRTGTFSANNLAAIGYQGVIQYDDVNKKVVLVAIPRVKITEVSNGATGTFNFAMTGLDTASASLTTTASGTPVSSSTFNGTVGTAVSITQTIPSGWPATPSSISCVDANGASTGNGTGALGTVSGVQVTLGTAQMVAGADITCTFTNTRNGISGAVFNDGGAPSGSTNTGTPNDGLQNGAESGVGGITVNLTNCSGTTYASTTTDGNGAFGLSIPTAQIGQTVCVQPVLAANTLATGANAAGTVLPDGSATSVGGVGYTYTRASQQASFTAPASGTVTLNFGQVPVSTLTPTAGRQQGRPGLRALHPHTFTAGTGGALKVQLGTATATPSTVTGWSEAAYLDANCTGALDLSAQQLGASTTLTVVQGQQLCFLVHEQVPATAPEGSSNAVPVTATLTFTNAAPGLSASFAATDTTTVSNSALQLTKEVRNVTQGVTTFGPNNQAKSGEVLEYRIKYANTALSPINSLVISDTTPGYTTFVQAKTETTPTSLTACTKVTPVNAGTSSTPAVPVGCDVAQTAGGIGPITWTFTGTLSSGGEGAVLFQVKVD